MRKWLAIFLLLIVPMQSIWAAGSSYCQHEKEITNKHLGHHTHQHKTQTGELSKASDPKSDNLDWDCGGCHAGCALALAAYVPHAVQVGISVVDPHNDRVIPLRPVETPDRPQWLTWS